MASVRGAFRYFKFGRIDGGASFSLGTMRAAGKGGTGGISLEELHDLSEELFCDGVRISGVTMGRQKTSGRQRSVMLGNCSRKRVRTSPNADESVVRPDNVSECRCLRGVFTGKKSEVSGVEVGDKVGDLLDERFGRKERKTETGG